MTDAPSSPLRVLRLRLAAIGLACAAAAGFGRAIVPEWQAHPFGWFFAAGLMVILARSLWWDDSLRRKVDALWPLVAFCWLATLMVVELDFKHLFGYDRFLPFLWLCCYGLALLQLGKSDRARGEAGWFFLFPGLLYGALSLFLPAVTEYAWLWLGGALAAGHFVWAVRAR
jgi:hypothetical protein